MALVIAEIATEIFPVCLEASLVCYAGAAWYLWSAAIIVANRNAAGSRFEKLIHSLHAATMEVNTGIYLASLFPLTLKGCHAAKGNPNGRPILMVNGLFSFASTWDYQIKKLVEAGRGPIYTMNVGSGQSIKFYAEQVKKRVEQIHKETGSSTITLIDHSKGGLVSTYYATSLAEKQTEVAEIITIGTPFKGAPAAACKIGADVAEMSPDSPFLQELQKKIESCPNTRFFHIASEEDRLVAPNSAKGKETADYLLFNDLGHTGLLLSSRVADQIQIWLEENKRCPTSIL